MIEKSESNQLSLATAPILGQAPSEAGNSPQCDKSSIALFQSNIYIACYKSAYSGEAPRSSDSIALLVWQVLVAYSAWVAGVAGTTDYSHHYDLL